MSWADRLTVDDTTNDSIFLACQGDEPALSAYSALQSAEQQYIRDKNTKKSDPPRFYAARDAVMAARHTFILKTGVIRLQVTHTKVMDEAVAERLEAATPAGQARIIKAITLNVVRMERAYRLSLDRNECLEGIDGCGALPMATVLPLYEGTPAHALFVHQHSIYRAMLSILVKKGPGGLKDAMDEWGSEALGDSVRTGLDQRYLSVTVIDEFIPVQTASGKNGYWEHDETYRVPLRPDPATLSAPAKVDRRRAHAERTRIAEGRPKRGRGRPANT